tara:strand:- start:119 stop:559 length:441 start_codon:yes stop_codon:yes gene_type:complete
MKKIKTLAVCLIVLNTNAQINLRVAEDYLKGDTVSLFSHLTDEGYVQTNDTVWWSNSRKDSVFEFTHKQRFDTINVIKNNGLIVTTDETKTEDYFLDYLKQLNIYLKDNSKSVKKIDKLDNGAVKLVTKHSIVYIIDPRQSLIMLY